MANSIKMAAQKRIRERRSSAKNKASEHQSTQHNAEHQRNRELQNKLPRSKNVKRMTILLGIIATVLIGIAGIVASDGHRSVAIWICYLSTVIYLLIAFKAWDDAVPTKNVPNHTPNELDKSSTAALTESKPSSAPSAISPATASPTPPPLPTQTPAIVLPVTTPSPIKLPSATPEHRVASLTLREVVRKLSDAINSAERGKYDELKNALKGLRVDWTLNFFSANRDSSGKSMRVWLHEKNEPLGLVFFDLPLAGNERLPLMEKTDVFRVRGIIDDPSAISIGLRDATLEYVSSDTK